MRYKWVMRVPTCALCESRPVDARDVVVVDGCNVLVSWCGSDECAPRVDGYARRLYEESELALAAGFA